jgi:hypothetical protein
MMSRTTAVAAAALAVFASTSVAAAAPSRSLTEDAEAWWVNEINQRTAPPAPFCLDTRGSVTYLLQAYNVGHKATVCPVRANNPVVIPIVTTAFSNTVFIGIFLTRAAFLIDQATNLSFSLDGHAEAITPQWRTPTPYFITSATEAQLPMYTIADGYFTTRSFPPGTHVVHTTGCYPSDTTPGAVRNCTDMTYTLVAK